jgi:hypothetical protein
LPDVSSPLHSREACRPDFYKYFSIIFRDYICFAAKELAYLWIDIFEVRQHLAKSSWFCSF